MSFTHQLVPIDFPVGLCVFQVSPTGSSPTWTSGLTQPCLHLGAKVGLCLFLCRG